MVQRTPMTVLGHRLMQEELQRLRSVERPKASKAIEIARAHGDLSENAEYDAAKEAQGMLEARIRDLEAKMSTAQVIDVLELSGDKVLFGATVRISDVDNGDEKVIMIVGEDEADVELGRISNTSPLARSLLGRNLDDVVRVQLPNGTKEYEILEVSFKPYA